MGKDLCVNTIPFALSSTETCSGYRTLADGSWKTAQRLVPELIHSCPTKTIRGFFRKCFRYMDAYRYVFKQLHGLALNNTRNRKGLNARQAAYAVKKYKSHCKVGPNIMSELDDLGIST